MNQQATAARTRLAGLERDLETQRLTVAHMERTCTHQWDHPFGAANHIYRKGYHIPGDPEGTMGVDRQLPMDVPAKTEERWTRTCQTCGKVEHSKKPRTVTKTVGGAF